jgi:predicted PurR-regulated permease PerM
MPLVVAFFAAAIFQPLMLFFNKIKIPKFISIIFVVIISFAIIGGIILILQTTISQISTEIPALQQNLEARANATLKWINRTFGSRLSFQYIYDQIIKSINLNWVASRAQDILSYLSSLTGWLTMFALYYVVLLIGLPNYKEFISYLNKGNNQIFSSNFLTSYEKIQKTIYTFLVIKTLINLLSGCVTYGLCLIFGIKFALFWGFLTFICAYIPNIGSIISTILPIFFALITLNSFPMILLFSVLLIGIHFVIGNFLEPVVMGANMSINTLTVIFGLVFWGYIWGVLGMILSVPLLVVLKLIFEQFPSLEFIARLMGKPDKPKKTRASYET